MTSVFLSYDRDDAAKARSIAHALEKSGHSVWWDHHIRGGSRYAAEIEKALSEAEAVVVLWSRQSVHSDWVRDEAAKGRDSGRLVPARIDDAEPPLGFGQHHTTDLSRWRGRTASPQFRVLLDAIDGVGGGETVARRAMPSRAKKSRAGQMFLIAAILAVLIIGIFLWRPWDQGPMAPVVAVVPVEGNPAARSLADDLFIKLGALQGARADTLHLIEQSSDAKADLKFRVDQQGDGEGLRATVALLAGDNGGLLWSREFQQERRREADLRQQVAYSAAQVLACALEAKSTGDEIETATLRLYLNGCAGLSEGLVDDVSLIQIFSKVAERAPNFEGGWAKLLLVETGAFSNSNQSDAALRKNLQAHIKQALLLNPTMAEAYIARSWLQPMRPISGWMPITEEAVRKNPHHAYALTHHSDDMFHVGRVQQAMEDMRQAVRSDPLSPSLRVNLINALANGNEYEEARKALEEAELLWPGANNLVAVRFNLMRRYGDPREALKMLPTAPVPRRFVTAMQSFLEARIDPSPAKIARAIDEARAAAVGLSTNYLQTLAKFGRKDELIEVLTEFDPNLNLGVTANFFQPDFSILLKDSRFMAIANRWGLVDYWRKSGKWPDFCFEPDLPYDCKVEAAKLAGRQG